MTFTPKIRWLLIGTGLVLTLVAVNWVDRADSIITTQASPTGPSTPPLPREKRAEPDVIHLEKLERAPLETDADTQPDDPFKSKSWYVAPPPPKPLPPLRRQPRPCPLPI